MILHCRGKLARSDFGLRRAAVRNREVRNDGFVFAAKRRVLGKAAYETLRELDEGLRWLRR